MSNTMPTSPSHAADPLTIEQFLLQPHEETLTELVQGEVHKVPPSGLRHGLTCAQIANHLLDYLEAHNLGRVTTNNSGVITTRNPDSVRGPDLCYYSYKKIPANQAPTGYPDTAPEIVFEVMSPSDSWADLPEKAAEFLRAGVNIVCVIDPESSTAQVFRASQSPQRVHLEEELTFEPLLPGFQMPLREILSP